MVGRGRLALVVFDSAPRVKAASPQGRTPAPGGRPRLGRSAPARLAVSGHRSIHASGGGCWPGLPGPTRPRGLRFCSGGQSSFPAGVYPYNLPALAGSICLPAPSTSVPHACWLVAPARRCPPYSADSRPKTVCAALGRAGAGPARHAACACPSPCRFIIVFRPPFF